MVAMLIQSVRLQSGPASSLLERAIVIDIPG